METTSNQNSENSHSGSESAQLEHPVHATATAAPTAEPPIRASNVSQGSTHTQNLTKREIDEKPWKYIGYRGYTEFLASENDFLIFRRFSSVSTRVALMLQHQVSELEEKLDILDWQYSRREAVDVNSGSFRHDEDDRKAVLEELRVKLLHYNEFLLQQAEVKKHPKASPQDIKSLEVWHWNHHNQAIAEEEHSYLYHKRDLFSLVPRDKTPLRKLLERSPEFRKLWFWKDPKPRILPTYDKDNIMYISDKRIDRFVTFVIVLVGMVMLITPMWILQALGGKTVQKLGTITAFIVAFLGMVSYATVAKPFETLGATAAYAAVLTVFLQFGGSTTSNSVS